MYPDEGVTLIHKGNRTNSNQKSLYILHTPDHYDCIKSIKSLFNTSYFCHFCKCAYKIEKGNHFCEESCKSCTRTYNCISKDVLIIPANSDVRPIKCEYCQIICNNELCYELHLKHVCRIALKCNICNDIKKRYTTHVCLNQKYCLNCKKAVDMDHKCYILTEKEKSNISKYKKAKQKNQNDKISKGLIFYDYEAFVNSQGIHQANLVIASRKCSNCLLSKECVQDCGLVSFEDNDSFCDWLFSKQNEGYTAIAHNFKGKYIFI